MTPDRHLTRLVPGLDAVAKPLDLMVRPTPVTNAQGLAERWRLAELRIKRDDLSSTAYGGSKLRNLEYFFGRAQMVGVSSVATMGPYGSHQVLATAVQGRRHGFRTRALLTPQPRVPEIVLNERLLPQFGMEVIRCGSFAAVPLGYVRARYARLGRTLPYWIPPGSHHPIGVLGVLEGALELAHAVRGGEIPMPDDVVVPTGTCATAAGLLLGLAIAQLPVRVVAVRMVPMLVTGPAKMRRLAARTLELLRGAGFTGEVRLGEMLWIDAQAGPGYGMPNPLGLQAAQDVAEVGGFRTETTYTAKTLGLLAGGALANRRVLFWNTFSAVDPSLADTPPPTAKDALP